MLGANNDWERVAGKVLHAPSKVHAAGEMHLLAGGKLIPEVKMTHGYVYTACDFPLGTLNEAWAGGMNDQGLSVAGTGVFAIKDIPGCMDGYLQADDIPLIILERASRAREAVLLIANLISQYGFAPSVMDGCKGTATFALADRLEGWIMELAPGNHWIATRVKDDEAMVRINCFGTHDADLSDKQNVLSSPGLSDFAQKTGLWDGDIHHFDFAGSFGEDHSPNEWGPEKDPMNNLRRWRALSLLKGEPLSEQEFIYAAHPDRKLGPHDFMDILRDVYKDTPYDLSVCPASNIYHNPFYDDPLYYSICNQSTVASIVTDFNLDSTGILWTALSTPLLSVYIPLYTDISSLPPICSNVIPGLLDEPSLFWDWKELALLSERRFEPNFKLIYPKTEAFYKEMLSLLKEEKKQISKENASHNQEFYTRFNYQHIEKAHKLCLTLKALVCYSSAGG